MLIGRVRRQGWTQRQAAAAAGAPPPREDIDAAPLPALFDGGVFDPSNVDDYIDGFAIRRRPQPAQ